jgi:hypothetical protein
MSKRVVNKIVAFTLIIATVVFFQGTGNSYAIFQKLPRRIQPYQML